MRLRWFAVLLVASLALSGCGSKGDAGPKTGDGAPDDADASALGGISGVVVTPTIQSIQGATVLVVETGQSTLSDIFGRFRFDVEPGTYRLQASAPDHDPAEQTVTVLENKTARPRLQLTSLVAAVPFHQTFQFDGRVAASLGPADGPADPVKDAAGAGACTCSFNLPVARLTVGITVEALWEDSISPGAVAPTEYRYNVTSGTGSAWAAGAGANPLRAHLVEADFTDGFAFRDHAVLEVGLLPDAIWPTIDQSYSLFVTVWEVAGPPEGWSYLNGDR